MIVIDKKFPDNCKECLFASPNLTIEPTNHCFFNATPNTCPLKKVHPEIINERISHTSWKKKTIYVED